MSTVNTTTAHATRLANNAPVSGESSNLHDPNGERREFAKYAAMQVRALGALLNMAQHIHALAEKHAQHGLTEIEVKEFAAYDEAATTYASAVNGPGAPIKVCGVSDYTVFDRLVAHLNYEMLSDAMAEFSGENL